VQFLHILSKFGCHGNSLCSLENLDNKLQFTNPEKLAIHRKIFFDFLHRTEISAILAIFCLNFVAINSLWSLENLIVYFNAQKFLNILYRTENYAILACFCMNLVAMAKPFAPWKIQIKYLNSTTPKHYHICKIVIISHTSLKSVHFWIFWPIFGCYGNSLCSLKILLVYLNSQTAKTLPYMQTLSPYLVQNGNSKFHKR